MGFFNNLNSNLGSVLNQTSAGRPAGGGLTDLLGPGLLGGLIGAFLPGKSGLLKTGGATALATFIWNKYKDRIIPPAAAPGQTGAAVSAPPSPISSPDDQTPGEAARRMIRALVFAAKSDGHIDDREHQAISQRLAQLKAGPAAIQLIQQAVNEPLDPRLVAAGVSDPQEAIALFLASCSVIEADHFMENAYLDSLAQTLGLPEQVKKDIEAEGKKQQ